MSYLDVILEKSTVYLKKSLSDKDYKKLLMKVEKLRDKDRDEIVDGFCDIYYKFQKGLRQNKYTKTDKELDKFISKKHKNAKLI